MWYCSGISSFGVGSRMHASRTVSIATARRLAIARQRLSGPPGPSHPAAILDLVRDLGCLQLDPISTVARTHLLVLWSRLGTYDPAGLDVLLWQDRSLFEYWAHAASIVLTEDYPFHQPLMHAYRTGNSVHGQRRQEWVRRNQELHDFILAEITAKGPLPSRYFEGTAPREGWYGGGWTSGRNITEMIGYLWSSGALMVAGRTGGQKLWDLAERCLPPWTPRDEWPEHERVQRAIERSLRALGVARPMHINRHFTRNRYPGLHGALKALEQAGHILRMQVQVADDGRSLPGPWYIHTDDLPLLERIEAGEWQPRTTLLSPFDNLICDRARTESLFGFCYRIEIYVPAAKRQYGYYVLPILHGDRLIGRIDPVYDRGRRVLTLNAIHAEPGAPAGHETAAAIREAIESLASFLGAKDIAYPGTVPACWAGTLR